MGAAAPHKSSQLAACSENKFETLLLCWLQSRECSHLDWVGGGYVATGSDYMQRASGAPEAQLEVVGREIGQDVWNGRCRRRGGVCI